MNFEELGDLHHQELMAISEGDLRNNKDISLLDLPVMIMDPDGDLLHFKTIEYDTENDCWIIFSEN